MCHLKKITDVCVVGFDYGELRLEIKKFDQCEGSLTTSKKVTKFDRKLKLRKSDRTLQFSTSVEVRVGIVVLLVRWLVSWLTLFPENRSKDFDETWQDCSTH